MTTIGWWPVIIPFNCDGFSLQSEKGFAWKLRTGAPSDTSSEKSCGATTQEIVMPSATTVFRGLGTRFSGGDTLCWVKSDEGDDVLIATWVGNP